MTRVVLPLLVVLLAVGAGTAALSQHPWSPRRDVVQPVPFSHPVHAGDNRIPCQYCHEYARRSQTAGVPPIQRCVGCHAHEGRAGSLEAVTQTRHPGLGTRARTQWTLEHHAHQR
jgi:hypothetical protein